MCTQLSFLCYLALTLLFRLTHCDQSLNEFDTYHADCPRIRRAWHLLSDAERDLYISGLMKLRENGQQNVDIDEVIAIGSVHADVYAPFIHKTSSYLFWHGYLTWELESRIRNLGGKYRCFAMPYWDFTLEAGREDHPLIFELGGLGGDGDPANHHQVNGYSWPFTTQQYWTPTDCLADDDQYPICSVKRALRAGFVMPTAQQIGDNIINNPTFADFATFSHISGQAVHLIDGDDQMDSNGDAVYQFTQSYEPIWYLFHSMIQYHQAIWTDCNQYDQIAVDELEKHPEAFQPFCNAYDTCTLNNNGYPERWLQWELDDPMHFGGKLIKHEWSFINQQDLTVRKLYSLPKWNIIYDLADGQGFYTDAGLKEWCDGKLNSSWFILDERGEESMNYDARKRGSFLSAQNVLFGFVAFGSVAWLGFVSLIVFGVCAMCYMYGYKTSDRNTLKTDHQSSSYGSMYSVYIS